MNKTAEIAKIEPNQMAAEVAITPMQMLKIAVEKGTDLDQLTKLMDLNDRYEKTQARKAFVAAKTAFKAEAPNVLKNKHVGFTSQRTGGSTDYDHATLDNVADTLSPILAAHGLSYSWETEQPEDAKIRVTCVLSHVLGHSERVTLQAGPDASGNKNSIQQLGSTVTFLQRYTLLSAPGIATKGQDNDGGSFGVAPISAEQKETLIALIKETGADTAKLCQYFGVKSVDEIHAAKFDLAVQMLEKKRKEKADANSSD